MRLTTGLLFLPLQQRIKTNTVDGEDTVASSRKVAVRLTFGTTNALDLNLIVFVYKVQCSVARAEGGHGLSVLYDLGSHASANSAVWLSTSYPDFLWDDGFALWRSLVVV